MPDWGYIVILGFAGLGVFIGCALIIGARHDQATQKAWEDLSKRDGPLVPRSLVAREAVWAESLQHTPSPRTEG